MTIDYATLAHLYTCWAQPINTTYCTMPQQRSTSAPNPEELQICDDPFPTRRITFSRYDAVFDKLRIGQRIKCPIGQAPKIADALQKYLKRKMIEGLVVRSISRYHDGHGGVWMLFKDPAAAAEYERRKKAAIKTEMRHPEPKK